MGYSDIMIQGAAWFWGSGYRCTCYQVFLTHQIFVSCLFDTQSNPGCPQDATLTQCSPRRTKLFVIRDVALGFFVCFLCSQVSKREVCSNDFQVSLGPLSSLAGHFLRLVPVGVAGCRVERLHQGLPCVVPTSQYHQVTTVDGVFLPLIRKCSSPVGYCLFL